MAKRKRLSPAQSGYLDSPGPTATLSPAAALGGAGEPPIAQVARDASATAALAEVSSVLEAARNEGRLIQSLPIEAVEREYLVRDRVVADDEEMAALKASLMARGQQTPIEVVDLGQGAYGLISGWRRLQALEALHRETGEARFATVQALLRQPETAGAAYTAMVEENEIRVGLSPFERARIVAKAVEHGVFPDTQTALRALFASASRAKRSKIGSFMRVVAALDGALRFPGAIGERLGLRLAKALETEKDLPDRLRRALGTADAQTPEAELVVIEKALRPVGQKPAPLEEPGPKLEIARKGQKLVLSGSAVTAELETRLKAWLVDQGF